MYSFHPKEYNSKKLRYPKSKPYKKNDPYELKLLLLAQHHKKKTVYIQIVTILIYIVMLIYSIFGQYTLFISNHNNVVAFIGCLNGVLLAVYNIFLVTSLSSSSALADVYKFSFKNQYIIGKINCRIFDQFLFALRAFPLIPIAIATYYLGILVGFSKRQYYIPFEIWYFNGNFILCTGAKLAMRVKENFVAVNNCLEEFDKNHSISVIATFLPKSKTATIPINNLEVVKRLSSHYTNLCNVLDNYNRYFKTLMVLNFICIMVNILFNITIITDVVTQGRLIIHGVDSSRVTLVLQGLYVINSTVQAGIMAYVGENQDEEGERTTRICYTLLKKMNRKIEEDQLIINELNFILDQSKSRQICIHAGCFFRLNFGILGSMTSTVATYSIVILQFLFK